MELSMYGLTFLLSMAFEMVVSVMLVRMQEHQLTEILSNHTSRKQRREWVGQKKKFWK